MQRLARLHHRRLAALPEEEPPASAPCQSPPLLALPQTLCALQAQIAALQQQVADLIQVVQHAHPPAIPEAPARQARATKRLPKPTPPAPKKSPTATAKPPRKPAHVLAHVLARVECGRDGHDVVICPKQGLLPFEPDSLAWFAWLATQSSFRFVGHRGRFTAHREIERLPKAAWRAHRQLRNHSSTLRLGQTQALTIAVLEQAAAELQAHLS